MALTATLFSFKLDIANQDSNRYTSHQLKVAQHPSETLERMVARVLAYCLWEEEGIAFGRGLSTPEDADLWVLNLRDEPIHWIEVGEPDANRLKKAARKGCRVSVLCYTRTAPVWWKKNRNDLVKVEGVEFQQVSWESVQELAALVSRNNHWSVSITDNTFYISGDQNESLEITITSLQ